MTQWSRSCWALALPALVLSCAAASGPADCPAAPVAADGGGVPASVAGVVAAQVLPAEQAMRRVAPSGKAWVTRLAQGENAFVGLLRLAPGVAVPEHRDPTEEYIYVLSGAGEVTVDDQVFPVAPGTMIFMPAGAKVSFRNGPEELQALQVFSGAGPSKKYDGWKPAAASPAPRTRR